MLNSWKKLALVSKIQILVITLIAIGVYWGLRSIPNSECGFLHYEVQGVSADGIEQCKADVGSFVDLTELKFPLLLEIVPEFEPRQGKPTHYTLMLRLNTGKILLPNDIMLSHTQRVHLLLVDTTSLEDYQHIHPQPLGLTGQWEFTFTPKKSGEYKVFVELVPMRTKKNIIGTSALSVSENRDELESTRIPGQQASIFGQYRATLRFKPEAVFPRQRQQLTLSIERNDSQVVTLEPIMGAYVHLVVFDENLKGLAHLHPIPQEEKLDSLKPSLMFSFFTPNSGKYKVWAQMKIEGQEIFIPFDLQVKDNI